MTVLPKAYTFGISNLLFYIFYVFKSNAGHVHIHIVADAMM